MSCQAQATRFAGLAGRWSGGINRLSSQQAFYSGLAVGATGSGLMSLLVAKRAEIGQFLNRWRAGSSEPAKKEPPANQPRPIPGLGVTSNRLLQKLPTPPTRTPQPIPALAARTQPVKLQAGPVRMQLGQAQSYTAADSYRLLRADGSETGLALTPYLTQSGPDQAIKRSEQWGLTHLGSGALVSGPYPSLPEAQDLGQQLTGLDWTKARLPAAEMERAKTIIHAYQPRRAE